jgi:hypothetical protein
MFRAPGLIFVRAFQCCNGRPGQRQQKGSLWRAEFSTIFLCEIARAPTSVLAEIVETGRYPIFEKNILRTKNK